MATTSLGTLTLDLVAKTAGFVAGMTKAERESEQFKRKVERNIRAVRGEFVKLSQATALYSSAATVALTAATKSFLDHAAEVQRFSTLANTSTDRFQMLAIASKQVGIEGDKLSDILKDVNDKMGEAVTQGGGPLADFITNIAPKVGLTAQSFAHLSGDEVLGKYIQALQDAGLDQQQMTTYMEMLASDSTALIPIFLDHAQALNEISSAAQQMGLVIENGTIKQAVELQAKMQALTAQVQGLNQQFMTQFVPSLNIVAAAFLGVGGQESLATDAGKDLGHMLVGLAKVAINVAGVFKTMGEQIGKALAKYKSYADAQSEKAAITLSVGPGREAGLSPQEKQKQLDAIDKRIAAGNKAIDEMYDKKMSALAAKANAALSALDSGDNESNSALNKMVDGYKTLLEQQKNLGNIQSTFTPLAKTAAKSAKKAAKHAKAQADALKAAREATQRIKQDQDAYSNLVASLRTPDEQRLATLKEQLAVIQKMQAQRDNGIKGAAPQDEINETRSRAIDKAIGTSEMPGNAAIQQNIGSSPLAGVMNVEEQKKALEDWAKDRKALLDKIYDNGNKRHEEYNAKTLQLEQDLITQRQQLNYAGYGAMLSAGESTFGQLASFAETYAGKSSTAYRAMFAVEKAFAIARAAVAIQAGIAQAAANPWPANLAAMASVAAATASIIANISSVAAPTGQAHDGIDSVKETGTWYLQKGERVTTAQTSAKLDNTLSQIQRNQSQKAGGSTKVNVINSIDPSMMSSYLSTDAGAKNVWNIIKSNPTRLKQVVQS